MTENLDRAIREASLLSSERQDEIAQLVSTAVSSDLSPFVLSVGQIQEVEARLLEDDEVLSLEHAKREFAGW